MQRWSFSLMPDRQHNNLLDRARLYPEKPSFAHLIKMNSVLAFWSLLLSIHTCCRQAKWSDGGARARLRVNVKRGDFLRTLGGAMTAQCKVLHLLFSQSDYPDIWASCHSECASFVSVGTAVAGWNQGPLTREQVWRGCLINTFMPSSSNKQREMIVSNSNFL